MADVWFQRDVNGAQTVTTADVLADHGSSAALEALSASASNTSSDGASTAADKAGSDAAASTAISSDASVAVDITKGLLDDKNNNLLI